ncbi:MAG: hypothetical protein JWM54_954, partial [Acidobacteriaceae bacterium]|nr:hypothetical protein [Acidobacteriaceae bacterium]
YGLMEASFSRTLNLQRDLYQSTAEYLEALEETQRQYVILNGFLYSEGLDPAGSADPVNRQSTGAAMATPRGSLGSSMSNSGLSALPWQGGSQ